MADARIYVTLEGDRVLPLAEAIRRPKGDELYVWVCDECAGLVMVDPIEASRVPVVPSAIERHRRWHRRLRGTIESKVSGV